MFFLCTLYTTLKRKGWGHIIKFHIILMGRYICNTCALSKHIGNMCMRLINGEKGEASPSLFPRFAPNTHIYLYWSGSSSRHFLRFLSNIFKKQSRNLCFTPLLFCMNHNDLPTKWIFIKESARWSGIHYYDVAIFNRKWPQQKQFSPTFRNIVFCEAKASKGKKNDILEN